MRPEWDNLRKRNEISLYTTLYLPAAAANLSAQKKNKISLYTRYVAAPTKLSRKSFTAWILSVYTPLRERDE